MGGEEDASQQETLAQHESQNLSALLEEQESLPTMLDRMLFR
jgi:hypothetical protein